MEKIKSVRVKYKELFAEDIEEKVISLYNSIEETKEDIYKLRVKIRELDSILKGKQRMFNDIKDIIDIEYEKEEFEEIKNNSNILIVNPTDASNRNYGKQ